MSMYTPRPEHTVRVYNGSGGTLLAHHLVVYTADADEAVDYATAGAGFDGVLYDDIADGKEGTMITGGRPLVACDAAVTAGDELAVGATGLATATATTNRVAAVAIEDLAAAGNARCAIYPGRKVTP